MDFVHIMPGVAFDPDTKSVIVNAAEVLEANKLPVTQETMLAVYDTCKQLAARLAKLAGDDPYELVLVEQEAPSLIDTIINEEEVTHGNTNQSNKEKPG